MSLLPIIFSYFNSSNSQLKHLFREFLLSSQILFPSALSYWVVEGEDQRRVCEFLDPTTLTCLSGGYKIHFMGYNFVLSIGFTGTTASAAWDWDSASNSKSWQCYGKRMAYERETAEHMAFLMTTSSRKARQSKVIKALPKQRPARRDWSNVWKSLNCSSRMESALVRSFS